MVFFDETEFFLRKLELDYGDERAEEGLKKISTRISWLNGWPENKKAFWNGESFMWGNKISKETREMIKEELKFLVESKKNLDLGCGSFSYVGSVGFDIAEKMLLLNSNLSEKVVGDLEKELPFEDKEFSSVTMVFILNYVENYFGLLNEVFRVLENDGKLVAVQPAEEVNSWQRQKAVNKLDFKEWKMILEKAGFEVNFYEKGKLGFFKCRKRNLAF